MDPLDDWTTLKQDAALDQPLRRVAYEAGMLLGLEATRDEQAYHRRRLNRHQYWMHGYGTVVGMYVGMSPNLHTNDTDALPVRLLVNPGVGIDRLGREILLHETHCLPFREWLNAQTTPKLLHGYDTTNGLLWLSVYVRQKDCPVARQPVLARKLNLSTDAVQPSRTADGVVLELVPEVPVTGVSGSLQPWGAHQHISEVQSLNATEQQFLVDAGSANPDRSALLALHALVLNGLGADGISADEAAVDPDMAARTLLARISVTAPDISNIVVNPNLIQINNLVRPFALNPTILTEWVLQLAETMP